MNMKATTKVTVTFDIVVNGLSKENAHLFAKESFIEQLTEDLEWREASNVKVVVEDPIVEEE